MYPPSATTVMLDRRVRILHTDFCGFLSQTLGRTPRLRSHVVLVSSENCSTELPEFFVDHVRKVIEIRLNSLMAGARLTLQCEAWLAHELAHVHAHSFTDKSQKAAFDAGGQGSLIQVVDIDADMLAIEFLALRHQLDLRSTLLVLDGSLQRHRHPECGTDTARRQIISKHFARDLGTWLSAAASDRLRNLNARGAARRSNRVVVVPAHQAALIELDVSTGPVAVRSPPERLDESPLMERHLRTDLAPIALDHAIDIQVIVRFGAELYFDVVTCSRRVLHLLYSLYDRELVGAERHATIRSLEQALVGVSSSLVQRLQDNDAG